MWRRAELTVLIEPSQTALAEAGRGMVQLRPGGRLELTPYGRESAAVAQRVLACYVLQLFRQTELEQLSGFSERYIREIVAGASLAYLTRPVRDRLVLLCIADPSCRREPAARREARIRAALETLAYRASRALGYPDEYSNCYRAQLAADLWLLSGAWSQDEGTTR